MLVRFKDGHIRTNLREDEQGGKFGDVSDSSIAFDLRLIRFCPAEELQFDFVDVLGYEIHMRFGMGELESLLAKELITADVVKYE